MPLRGFPPFLNYLISCFWFTGYLTVWWQVTGVLKVYSHNYQYLCFSFLLAKPTPLKSAPLFLNKPQKNGLQALPGVFILFYIKMQEQYRRLQINLNFLIPAVS